MVWRIAWTTPRGASCSIASSRWSFRATSWKRPRELSNCWCAKRCGPGLQLFEVVSYEVTTKTTGSTATVTLKAQDGVHSATASGNGPVNALDLCLRQCLSTLYPGIAGVRLTDYKVRVLDNKKGTAARVRVLVEWSDHRRSWATVGVSENVIEASWFALVDALRLELMRLGEKDPDDSSGPSRTIAGASEGRFSEGE